jgi:hypothetical protein
MIDTDDLDNMSRRDLVELLEAYNESLAEVKRLREAIAGIVTDMDEDWRFWRRELKKVIV